MARYRIPKCRTRVETRAGNSRFITTVDVAPTVRAAQEFVRSIRAEMPDATHHVYAFKVGYGGSVSEGMSDDGEPSGTAGPPTLAVLRGADIGDIVLVTTRYFGGTKLGTGGLVAAYTHAAQAVLAELDTIEKVHHVGYVLRVPYNLHEQVRRLLPTFECEVEREDFAEQVTLRVQLPEERTEAFVAGVGDLSAGRVVPERVD